MEEYILRSFLPPRIRNDIAKSAPFVVPAYGATGFARRLVP